MYNNISNEEFKGGMYAENCVLLDVRTKEEFDSGFIKGAKLIDIMSPAFADSIQKLDKSKTYYVYCRSGGRSGSACGAMANWGFGELHNLANGILGWDGETETNS